MHYWENAINKKIFKKIKNKKEWKVSNQALAARDGQVAILPPDHHSFQLIYIK